MVIQGMLRIWGTFREKMSKFCNGWQWYYIRFHTRWWLCGVISSESYHQHKQTGMWLSLIEAGKDFLDFQRVLWLVSDFWNCRDAVPVLWTTVTMETTAVQRLDWKAILGLKIEVICWWRSVFFSWKKRQIGLRPTTRFLMICWVGGVLEGI